MVFILLIILIICSADQPRHEPIAFKNASCAIRAPHLEDDKLGLQVLFPPLWSSLCADALGYSITTVSVVDTLMQRRFADMVGTPAVLYWR